MENRGRWVVLLKPRFKPFSSLVITQEALISLPEADRVRMVPTGRAPAGAASLVKNFHTSTPGFPAPSAMHLAESITLPPPTARTKSAFSARHSSIPFFAMDRVGLAWTPPSCT